MVTASDLSLARRRIDSGASPLIGIPPFEIGSRTIDSSAVLAGDYEHAIRDSESRVPTGNQCRLAAPADQPADVGRGAFTVPLTDSEYVPSGGVRDLLVAPSGQEDRRQFLYSLGSPAPLRAPIALSLIHI